MDEQGAIGGAGEIVHDRGVIEHGERRARRQHARGSVARVSHEGRVFHPEQRRAGPCVDRAALGRGPVPRESAALHGERAEAPDAAAVVRAESIGDREILERERPGAIHEKVPLLRPLELDLDAWSGRRPLNGHVVPIYLHDARTARAPRPRRAHENGAGKPRRKRDRIRTRMTFRIGQRLAQAGLLVEGIDHVVRGRDLQAPSLLHILVGGEGERAAKLAAIQEEPAERVGDVEVASKLSIPPRATEAGEADGAILSGRKEEVRVGDVDEIEGIARPERDVELQLRGGVLPRAPTVNRKPERSSDRLEKAKPKSSPVTPTLTSCRHSVFVVITLMPTVAGGALF